MLLISTSVILCYSVRPKIRTTRIIYNFMVTIAMKGSYVKVLSSSEFSNISDLYSLCDMLYDKASQVYSVPMNSIGIFTTKDNKRPDPGLCQGPSFFTKLFFRMYFAAQRTPAAML